MHLGSSFIKSSQVNFQNYILFLYALFQNIRKSGFGASDELSSEEEEGSPPEEAHGLVSLQERHPVAAWPASPPNSSVRKRNLKLNHKPSLRPQVSHLQVPAQDGPVLTFCLTQDVSATFSKAKPREVERLMPAASSRPASDTDDAMWEELLQGPDSASSESSDSEGNARYAAGITLPQTTSLSTDDESLQQEFTGVRQLTSDLICAYFSSLNLG